MSSSDELAGRMKRGEEERGERENVKMKEKGERRKEIGEMRERRVAGRSEIFKMRLGLSSSDELASRMKREREKKAKVMDEKGESRKVV